MTRDGVIELLKFYGFTQVNDHVWDIHKSTYPYIYVGKSKVRVQFKGNKVSEYYEHMDLKWITEAIEDVLNTPESN